MVLISILILPVELNTTPIESTGVQSQQPENAIKQADSQAVRRSARRALVKCPDKACRQNTVSFVSLIQNHKGKPNI